MEVVITVDNREKAIFDEIRFQELCPPVFKYALPVRVVYESLQIGDYLITIGDTIMAVIERKTLKDYAASIIDGRQENVEKLVNLRETTGCQIYYLIEGTPNPGLDSQHARMEYKKILASIRRLQILRGIHVIDAKNKTITAREIWFLAEVYCGLVADGRLVANPIEGALEKSMPSKEESNLKHTIASWQSLPGVGRTTAVKLADYPLISLLDMTKLAGVISAKVASQISEWTIESQVKFFATIPSISLASAKKLVTEISVLEFMACVESGDSRLSKLTSKKMGAIVVAKIRTYLNSSRPTVAPDAS
jgi:ERCC4-type nuclease